MHSMWLAMFAIIGTPAGAAAQSDEIVVTANLASVEIERILRLDNLDTGWLSPRDVAETMDRIARGRAPQDFWLAYRTHVEAWIRLADATERARSMLGQPLPMDEDKGPPLAHAELAIDVTFDEVERIAKSYGAKMPVPRSRLDAIA